MDIDPHPTGRDWLVQSDDELTTKQFWRRQFPGATKAIRKHPQRMASMSKKAPNPEAAEPPDTIWGAKANAAEINRTEQQFYRLLASGALRGAARKLGHKTIVGSRKALHSLHLEK